MNLPSYLLDQVRQGRVVLFLGAGAIRGARKPDGSEPPLGNELRERIARKFLTGDYSSESLSWVSELAIAATNLFEVQDFIADQFRDLKPADYHHLIPMFRWRGIATTNYDCVTETIYNISTEAVQEIVSFLSNADRVDEKLRDRSSLALLKLHGCITRTHDPKLPLILTMDQYATYKDERTRLFQMLEEWGSENTIIFIGHRLLDPNLRGILLDLSQRIPSRPRYFLVRPGVNSDECTFWNGKQISVLDGTFEDLLKALDGAIVKSMRPLAKKLDVDHPISIRFTITGKPSPSLLEFLENDFEYVHEGISITEGNPPRFYSGFGLGWYPIQKNLDVRRGLTDKLLDDIVLRSEEDRPSKVELYVVKAEAGAGKSVLLRRLAWDAANSAGALCLFSRGTTSPSLEAMRELSASTNERIFLFIDNAADRLTEIRALIDFARSRKIRLTLITAERLNEWNVRCESLEEYLSDKYQLYYLNHAEIEKLVQLLTEYKALGTNLVGKTFEERVKEFEKKTGRQLLVALHEATNGRPFEEILLDEYNSIIPQEAQRLYLTVCVLNRLKVPVRAGLISRVHGIPFEEFRKRFFRPLEHVVDIVQLPWGDYAYQARHSEIAQIVFEQVLTDMTERFNEYIRIVFSLNPIYSTDREALRGFLRAKSLHELFSNYEDVNAIYTKATETFGDDAYLLQQRANYERIRSKGNLRLAQSLLEKARYIDPTDSTIVHTLTEVLRARAEAADKRFERERLRSEALSLLRSIASTSASGVYAIVTQIRLYIDNLSDLLTDESSTGRDIDEALRNVERALDNARQLYPGDEYILVAEANFAKLLKDHKRVLEVLKQAHKLNPRDPYIASRLAAILEERGEHDPAIKCIEEALESNRGEKRLNFQYAELLRTKLETPNKDLVYYYRRAFSKWDQNYDSQFWFARFAFGSDDPEIVSEAKEVFRHLREIPMSYDDRVRVQDSIGGLREPKQFSGTITRVEASHGFLSIDGRGDILFFHENDVADGIWANLSSGKRVTFTIGFSLRGPKGLTLRLEGGVA